MEIVALDPSLSSIIDEALLINGMYIDSYVECQIYITHNTEPHDKHLMTSVIEQHNSIIDNTNNSCNSILPMGWTVGDLQAYDAVIVNDKWKVNNNNAQHIF